MAVDREPNSEVIAEIKLDDIDRGDQTCFLTVEIEKDCSLSR